MNRRDFIASSAGGALGSALPAAGAASFASPDEASIAADEQRARAQGDAASLRRMFPRLESETFLNAAAGTPLGEFAERGLREYEEFWRLGPGDGRGAAVGDMLDGTKAGLARLIGATPGEIAFVQCTKEGEQIVLDGLPALWDGGNLVTNDLHFGGSLHNLIGLRRAGLDVRIVRSTDWKTSLDAMAAAIDDRTALVSVTLVSNVNGHIEPMREIADIAHAHGAWVYADIIQATGIVPIDVNAMGIDFAAGNGYKWLFGPHGTGFLYVRESLQGDVLQDRMFPGHSRHNYSPWVESPESDEGDFGFSPRQNADRYQPGHSAYLCYAALHEGLGFVEEQGVDSMRMHSVRLNQRLLDGLDGQRYSCISPHVDRSPIITFRGEPELDLETALGAADVVVSLSAGNQIRVSPAVFNDENDIDALIAALNNA